jgi:hypothetical protein
MEAPSPSVAMSNPVTNADRSSRKKKKRKSSLNFQSRNNHQIQNEIQIEKNSITRWRSEKQQQIYSSKLLQALNQVRSTSPAQNQTQPRRAGKVVREAADMELAAVARGRTLWSRAILTNRLKLKFRKQTNRRMQRLKRSPPAAVVTGSSNGSRSTKRSTRVSVMRLKRKNLPAVQRKVRVLGQLVPGCRKQPFPVILEEVTDYIAALEMQVRAMSRLAELLSGTATEGGSSSSSA